MRTTSFLTNLKIIK